MAYQYLNPIYGVRRRFRRRCYVITILLSLAIVGGSLLYQIDMLIRATMMPSATGIFRVVEIGMYEYRVEFMGEVVECDLSTLVEAKVEISEIVRTPPAPVRVLYQLHSMLRGELPENKKVVVSEKTFV